LIPFDCQFEGDFRVVAPKTNWGTTVVLFPIFILEGYQTYPLGGGRIMDCEVEAVREDKLNLHLYFTCPKHTPIFNSVILLTFSPPQNGTISVDVRTLLSPINKSHPVTLDLNRKPGEAFKPIELRSMCVSSDTFDCKSAYNGKDYSEMPINGGFIWSEGTRGNRLTLDGGITKRFSFHISNRNAYF
jgi:hypothetical protein